jgi:UDP-2-acetamido-2-deoxy-ribo-hexuluronate aminotransferase
MKIHTLRMNNRDALQLKSKENGIPSSVLYPISLQLQVCSEYLNYKNRDFSIAEKASNEVMNIPVNTFLINKKIDYIIYNIRLNKQLLLRNKKK